MASDEGTVKEKLKKMNALTLAYMGDSVFELLVRQYLILDTNKKPDALHKSAIKIVNAEFQAKVSNQVQKMLTDEEMSVFRRGRNSKPGTKPKHATSYEYSNATGLEALFGWLYFMQRYDRITELFSVIKECIQ